MSSKAFETIIVAQEEVICDGNNTALGHPRVFLHIDRATNEVTCPYCSRHFVLSEKHRHAHG